VDVYEFPTHVTKLPNSLTLCCSIKIWHNRPINANAFTSSKEYNFTKLRMAVCHGMLSVAKG
jgi:hypothetical protein